MQFHTRFNVAPCKNKDKVYDVHDNVDRVSYMDNTKLIQRFIYEGHNLAEVRAKALRSGMYSGDLKEIADESGIVTPVYALDPAIAQPIIESAKATLESRVSEAKEKRSESVATENSDSTKPNNDTTEK